MRHYRCKECEALFAAEPLHVRSMPNTAHCVFCGGEAKAFEGLQGIAMVLASGRNADLAPHRVES